ncbi:OmpA family protein [Prosthecobacter sp. SYSU 5D2]|uniref:OmpA family protein n=1 Tax=Prosthecobacter sp. SYSU 5D2 TaxID=3134134 RepID=UPI0031FEF45F
MKTTFLFLSALAVVQLPVTLNAQVTVVTPPEAVTPPSVVIESGVVTPSGAPQAPGVETRGRARAMALDAAEARRQLSVAPQVIVVQGGKPPAVTAVPVPTPSTDTVKTTKTTTVIETPGQPTRVYNAERNVVVIQDQGQNRELPYVTLPVLFVKETAELLDDESRKALEQIAGVIMAIVNTESGTVFDIEGHTSTDGTDEFNMELSAARAKRIYDELTQNYGVPANVLSAHGYGEMYPRYPEGTEEQMQMDRRVLVVRTK